jgi:tight adherence protein B
VIKDYDSYTFTKKEWIQFFLQGAAVGGIVGYLFYSNLMGVLILMSYGFLFVHYTKKRLIEERKWQLNLQFRDALTGISAALNAGYSMENALSHAVGDLRLIYPKDVTILLELEGIINQINTNKTLEEAWDDLARRSKVEDIANFTEVLVTGKRTGGDLIKIIKATESAISDKIEVKREIKTMITGKSFETKIMCSIPFGIIFYLKLFSPGFLDPIYHNLFGVIFMTILLVVYYVAYWLAHKITDIEI